MALKYCQSHKCHTYDTKDRKRGKKGQQTNQTRRRSSFYYGNGNFCSLNCYNDWADQFMEREIDQVSGRLHEPMTMSEENAWVKKRRYHWGNGNGYTFSFVLSAWVEYSTLELPFNPKLSLLLSFCK